MHNMRGGTDPEVVLMEGGESGKGATLKGPVLTAVMDAIVDSPKFQEIRKLKFYQDAAKAARSGKAVVQVSAEDCKALIGFIGSAVGTPKVMGAVVKKWKTPMPPGISVQFSPMNNAYIVKWGDSQVLRVITKPHEVEDYLKELGSEQQVEGKLTAAGMEHVARTLRTVAASMLGDSRWPSRPSFTINTSVGKAEAYFDMKGMGILVLDSSVPAKESELQLREAIRKKLDIEVDIYFMGDNGIKDWLPSDLPRFKGKLVRHFYKVVTGGFDAYARRRA